MPSIWKISAEDTCATGESDRVARPAAYAVWAVLGASLLVHLWFIPLPGHRGDLALFDKWMRAALRFGVVHLREHTWCDYPPGYLYLLKAVGLLWTTVSGLSLPPPGSPTQRLLLKLIPTGADLGAAYVLYRIAAARRGPGAALAVCAAYAFNPAMLFNSAVWGQADSLIAFLLLLSVWAVSRSRIASGFAVWAAAVSVKLQAVVVLPALLLSTYRVEGGKGILNACWGAAGALLLVLFPFYWAQTIGSVITIVRTASGRYPFLSLYALNVWWFFAGSQSRWTSDAMRAGNGLLSYYTLGILMLGIATGLILVRLSRQLRGGQDPAPALFAACGLQVLAFYLFPTEMHERYIVPALVLFAAAAIWTPGLWWAYGLASVGTFVSLTSTLALRYPKQLGTIGALLPATPGQMLLLSGLFIALFGVVLFWTSDRVFQVTALGALAVATTTIVAVTRLPLRGPQRLCDWEPIEQSRSDSLHHDSAVNGGPLSVHGLRFRHGMGMPVPSSATFHLNRAFRVFDTVFAIDDAANSKRPVRFRVLVDNQLRYESEDDPLGVAVPQHVTLSVEGANLLTLEVLGTGRYQHQSAADWLEPTLLR